MFSIDVVLIDLYCLHTFHKVINYDTKLYFIQHEKRFG
jgi:hypothetical protein